MNVDNNNISIDSNMLLLGRFNNRHRDALGEVYLLYYRELLTYAHILYREYDVLFEDVVHDTFINIWESSMTFKSIDNIKNYAYKSIKNSHLNYLKHNKYVEDYSKTYTSNRNNTIDINIIESEIYSTVTEITSELPAIHAKVIKMYLDGWKLIDIANELNKSENYIYKVKHEAIKILKKKNISDKLLFIISILGI